MARPASRRALTAGPGRPRKRGGGAGTVLLAALAILVTGALAGGGVWLWRQSQAEAVDPVTLCPATGPKAALAMLLDLTDPLSPAQERLVRNRVGALVEAAEPGTLLVLGVVSPDPDLRAAPRIAVCKPQSGTEASALYQNPRLVETRFREGFAEPFAAAFASTLALAPADSSPIMESLQALVATGLADLPAGVPVRLVVVSDLMQHSAAFSLYRGGSWERFAASPEAARLGESLRGVAVTLLQLPRPDVAASLRPEVLAFWGNYFDRQGAARVMRETVGDL
jgi:hypothetical protein